MSGLGFRVVGLKVVGLRVLIFPAHAVLSVGDQIYIRKSFTWLVLAEELPF